MGCIRRNACVIAGIAGLGLAAACGRLGFDAPGGLDGAHEDDASGLDDTICDELSGVLFCDGFEGPSQLSTEDATAPSFVVAEAGAVYRGQRALHAVTTRSNEPAWWLGGVLGGVTAGELHARWYHYLPASVVNPQLASVHLVSNLFPNGGVVFGIAELGSQIASTEAGLESSSPVTVGRDRWSCVQVRIVLSETAGLIETWIDGAPAARLDGVDTLPDGGYMNLHAGMWATGFATGPLELWTDEVVASTSSIPCD